MILMAVAILALATINIVYKALGPAVLGDYTFPPRVQVAVDALPAALLAALIVVALLGAKWEHFDWTLLPGLAVALGLRACRRSHLVCIVAAIACTAIVRVIWQLTGT